MIAPGAGPSALAGLILILVPKLRGITSGRSVDGISSEYITHAGVVADWSRERVSSAATPQLSVLSIS
jgi:hypothetical protein